MQAVHYRAPDGTEPVRIYLRSLKGRREPNIKNQLSRLNMLGPAEHLPIEYSKQVEGEDTRPRVPPRAAGHDAP